jgi:rRNA maturation protein Nop10
VTTPGEPGAGEELVARELCPICGTSWQVGEPPAGAWCESVELDRVVAWLCVACGSWWRIRTPGIDQFSPLDLAGRARLDAEKLRGWIAP